MDIKQNGSTKAEPFHIDKNIITQFENIFQGREDRVGILKGRKPDGKKNQYTLDQAFDAEKHLNLELLQGLEPTKEGQCKWLFEDFAKEIKRLNIDNLEKVCGVSRESIKEAAIAYATAKNSMEFHGLGVTEHTQGSKTVMLIADLAMITGNLGRKGVALILYVDKTMYKVLLIWDANLIKALATCR